MRLFLARLLSHHSVIPALAAASFVLGVPARAAALEPLDTYLRAAETHDVDARAADSTTTQRDEEASAARAKLLPVLGASATYTRNQYEAVVTLPPPSASSPPQTATITPLDQRDLVLTATLPIVDIGAWRRIAAADATAAAQHAHRTATRLDVEDRVTRAYYQVAADESVLEAARRALAASDASLGVVHLRRAAGTASELDVDRAIAEVEQRKQAIAAADYGLSVARRTLETMSGLPATPGASLPGDDLHDEAPLDAWEARAGSLPAVQASVLDATAADRTASATLAAAFPTLTATATERFTNATGFGQSPTYAIAIGATWRFDVSTLPATRASEASADAAHVRAEGTWRTGRDQIHSAWQEVRSLLAKSRAARAQRDASSTAAALARERYGAGTATLLDVVIAERDAFDAEVAAVQTDADLAYARAALRLSAGVARGGTP
jgi:outer membrane protein TolC